jgi:hypothetical protein
VDTRHEVSLAYGVRSTEPGDNEMLPKLVDQGQSNLPEGRIETLAYDKAAEDIKSMRSGGRRVQNRAVL